MKHRIAVAAVLAAALGNGIAAQSGADKAQMELDAAATNGGQSCARTFADRRLHLG